MSLFGNKKNEVAKAQDNSVELSATEYFDRLEQTARDVVGGIVLNVPTRDLREKSAEEQMGMVLSYAHASVEGLDNVVNTGTQGVVGESRDMVVYTIGNLEQTRANAARLGEALEEQGVVESQDMVQLLQTIELGSSTAETGVEVLGYAQNGQYEQAAEAFRPLLEQARDQNLGSIDYKEGCAFEQDRADCKAIQKVGAASDGEKLYAALIVVNTADDARKEVVAGYKDSMVDASTAMIGDYDQKSGSLLKEANDLLGSDGNVDTAGLLERISKATQGMRTIVDVAKTATEFNSGDVSSAVQHSRKLPGVGDAYDNNSQLLKGSDQAAYLTHEE